VLYTLFSADFVIHYCLGILYNCVYPAFRVVWIAAVLYRIIIISNFQRKCGGRMIKNGFWVKYIIHYLTVILIAVALMLIVCLISFKVFQDDAIRKNAVLVGYMQQNFDNRLTDISKLSYAVSCDDHLLTIIKNGGTASADEAAELSSSLQILKSTSDIIGDIAVYFPQSKQVISSYGPFSIQCYYRLSHQDNQQAYVSYLASLKEKDMMHFIVSQDIPNNKKPESNIYFYHTILMNGLSDMSPKLIIKLDTTKITTMINSLFSENCDYFAIMDSKYHPIVDSGDKTLQNQIKKNILNNSNQVQTISETSEIVTHISSIYSGIHYVTIIKKSILLNALNSSRNMVIFVIIIIICLDFIIAFYFSKKDESPIKAITNALGTKISMAGSNRNVYQYIENNIKKIIEENTNISTRLRNQDTLLKSIFITRLLKGEIDDQTSFINLSNQYEIDNRQQYNCVLILYLDSVTPVMNQNTSDSREFDDTLLALVCASVEKTYGNEFSSQTVYMDGLYNIWLAFSDIKDAEVQLEQYGTRLIKYMYSEYNVAIRIARGGIYDNFNQISLSYLEALQTLEQLVGSKEMIYLDYSSMKKKSHKAKSRAIDLLSKFLYCLKLQDYGNAIIIIEPLFSEYLSPHLSQELYILHKSALISIILDAVEQAQLLYGKPDYCNNYQCLQIASSQTGMFKNAVLETIQSINNLKENYEDDGLSQTINTVKNFIDKNYSDPNLGLYMIAEHFKMNNNHLSKIFKKKFNVGILDYMNMVRINKSKELLSSSDYKILQISQKVGYISDITFIRVFKRYEGTTPGRYRDNPDKKT
jgi:two-component system response regulator YesN